MAVFSTCFSCDGTECVYPIDDGSELFSPLYFLRFHSRVCRVCELCGCNAGLRLSGSPRSTVNVQRIYSGCGNTPGNRDSSFNAEEGHWCGDIIGIAGYSFADTLQRCRYCMATVQSVGYRFDS